MRPQVDVPVGQVPAGTIVYAIGDVHGRRDLLAALRRSVFDDAAQRIEKRRVLVYLGDYVDRGPESRGVVQMLRDEPLPGFETVMLRGNHEDMLVQAADGGSGDIIEAWLTYGGIETLRSYGAPEPVLSRLRHDSDPAGEVVREFVPQADIDWMRSLAHHHREGGYLFVHAGIRPGVAFDQQRTEDLMWIRDPFLKSDADLGAVVVHGHTPRRQPEVRRNRINVDTGAFATGVLTCVVLTGSEQRFVVARQP
ncbi:MAG: serine/threonine protein phosphatase [Alphaproteobacteria bacterium]|nr:serine/threonine protein phosphatase [Alphaproteobacteria bacterium]